MNSLTPEVRYTELLNSIPEALLSVKSSLDAAKDMIDDAPDFETIPGQFYPYLELASKYTAWTHDSRAFLMFVMSNAPSVETEYSDIGNCASAAKTDPEEVRLGSVYVLDDEIDEAMAKVDEPVMHPVAVNGYDGVWVPVATKHMSTDPDITPLPFDGKPQFLAEPIDVEMLGKKLGQLEYIGDQVIARIFVTEDGSLQFLGLAKTPTFTPQNVADATVDFLREMIRKAKWDEPSNEEGPYEEPASAITEMAAVA